jgi:rhodanese-related sulfurtransferase
LEAPRLYTPWGIWYSAMWHGNITPFPRRRTNGESRMLKLFHRGETGYQDLSSEQVAEALRGNGIQLIDVRSKEEFAQGHLRGAALVPVGNLEAGMRTLRTDAPVIVYCLSGARSARAARLLAEKGFTDVRNMKGGIRHWRGEIVR